MRYKTALACRLFLVSLDGAEDNNSAPQVSVHRVHCRDRRRMAAVASPIGVCTQLLFGFTRVYGLDVERVLMT